MTDDLMAAFIEDSREHLESIEADIMALEKLGGAYEEELINRIFRTAHSIKGAAGFFGLEAIGSLAHKLENALHLLRDQKLLPDRPTCQILLEGFDQLRSMINDPDAGERQDIKALLGAIQGLLTPESIIGTETTLQLRSNHGHSIFDVDLFTLDQGLKGGKFLYHIEFDLIHDMHRKDKTPYEIIKTLQDTGLILDCSVDIEATGTLEKGFAQNIPMNVLFASIIDPDVIGTLIDVPAERIRELDRSMFRFQCPSVSAEAAMVAGDHVPQADVPWSVSGDQAVLRLGEELDLASSKSFRTLFLEAPRDVSRLTLDLRATSRVDAAGLQVLIAALRTCTEQEQGLVLLFGGQLREQFQNLGFGWLLEDDA